MAKPTDNKIPKTKKAAPPRRHIVLHGKEYTMPDHVAAQAHLAYMDAQDDLAAVEAAGGAYRRAQYDLMARTLCEVWGNQFTVEDVYAPGDGLTLADLVAEFTAVEITIARDVEYKLGEITANFTTTA